MEQEDGEFGGNCPCRVSESLQGAPACLLSASSPAVYDAGIPVLINFSMDLVTKHVNMAPCLEKSAAGAHAPLPLHCPHQPSGFVNDTLDSLALS